MMKSWLVTHFNKNYFLKAGNKVFRCQIGQGGFNKAEKKIEGDKTTPIGKWYFKAIYYRSDKVLRPKLKKKDILKINKITKNCGWCDDIRSHYYNKYVKTNTFRSFDINYETLWRDDDVYDIIIETTHNVKPTIKNKGSAIFIHCSFSDNRKTSGCVALKQKDLIFLLKNLRSKTHINIQSWH